jgi:hypothetical protein
MAITDIEILRRGKPVLGDVEAGRAVPENHQPFCIFIRKWPQQQSAGHAKIAVLAPMPMASEITAAAVNPRPRQKTVGRSANLAKHSFRN